ncbi:MAG: signal recognition particle protein [Desulfarculaceae bacterium]|nr:signal recognition particle protein [Desulfarculaceae bacterium]MCF8046863.1 signal recognition particle protein [Desulfarculaceae bacterium]MCF8098351.1 signal recognition particle protein [Desulfarculaceae bacterium]MCF8121370.1 signal recognition particle protein [Desulfarculaceae bacterium]
MFDNLSDRLALTFKRLKGHGKLSESNISEALREVRLALLEADVNYKVAKDFIAKIKDRAVGQEVMKSLTPAQQVIKIVRDELCALMGGEAEPLNLGGKAPHLFMMVGLQGSGKTTTSGKLALMLKKQGRNPYLVPADTQRPAAIEQLKKLGAQIQVPVFDSDPAQDPVDICIQSLSGASRAGCDVIILDTAGRLHVDHELMAQLERIQSRLQPQEVLLVADAMTGQDAVNVAQAFHEQLGLTGVVLTKVEGDARGGAALSIRAVSQVPIKLVGVGEKLDAIEAFHPDRLAGRILGMGDMLTLVEKAGEAFEAEKAEALAKKMATDNFTLDDFRDQLQQLKKMGSLDGLLSMLPGAGKLKGMKNLQPDEKELKRTEAIINSMTPGERGNHQIINSSRRKRIARGSGTSVSEVNRLLKNFTQARKMMKGMAKMGGKKKQLARLMGAMQ